MDRTDETDQTSTVGEEITVGVSTGAGPLTPEGAFAWLRETAFTTSVPGRVGVEVEFLVPLATTSQRDRFDRGPLPTGGLVSEEPGGQLEVSTRTCDGLADAVTSTAVDVAELRRRAEVAGMTLLGEGTAPEQLPPRRTHHPRYVAMERYFDRYGDAGRQMMRATASLQITLESGLGVDAEHRWRTMHAIGPALVAAFANSPFLSGRDTGWASNRQRIWWALDPRRTRPISAVGVEVDPSADYARYALEAPLMLRPQEGRSWTVDHHITFNEWLEKPGGFPAGPPTIDDLKYHLTTLFPPIRPRGAVEVRYLDAQRADGWVIPLAVVFAIIEDERCRAAALEVCRDTEDLWVEAARDGLANPALRSSAAELMEIAAAGLSRQPSWLGHRVLRFADEYTRRGRCPADDLREVGPGARPSRPSVLDEPIRVPVGADR